MKTKLIALIFYTLCVLLVYAGPSGAQTSLCGTVTTKKYMEADIAQFSMQAERGLFYPNKCLQKTLSITVYIMKDSTGNTNVALSDIQAGIQLLNAAFSPICLSFQICQTFYVDNFNYDDFRFDDDDAEVRALHYTENTINVYYVNKLISSSGAPVNGYAYMPGGPDCIFIKKSAANSGKTIPHEFGHFFGLYHTFETVNGIENINGSNCAIAGDLVCDTPADPDPTGTLVSGDCQSNPYQQDAGGNWYLPQIGNLMSYYPYGCNCGFTTQQYNRMALQFLTNRSYLW